MDTLGRTSCMMRFRDGCFEGGVAGCGPASRELSTSIGVVALLEAEGRKDDNDSSDGSESTDKEEELHDVREAAGVMFGSCRRVVGV